MSVSFLVVQQPQEGERDRGKIKFKQSKEAGGGGRRKMRLDLVKLYMERGVGGGRERREGKTH